MNFSLQNISFDLCTALVNASATCLSVLIYSISISLLRTRSLIKWYLMSMCVASVMLSAVLTDANTALIVRIQSRSAYSKQVDFSHNSTQVNHLLSTHTRGHVFIFH
eukprot:GHVQ01039471.1.p1 GENE.GHVQ01039471.1~~GHVQ01039471.1.p1  ORF type:complete len:107 (+),score=4.23 GHVQ01039471.1:142-462(+)